MSINNRDSLRDSYISLNRSAGLSVRDEGWIGLFLENPRNGAGLMALRLICPS